MADLFESSRVLITRAKENISDLDSRIKGFVNTKPYEGFSEVNPDGISYSHKIRMIKPLPGILAAVASDATNNLRSSLDNACYAISQRYAGNVGVRKLSAAFPFSSNVNELNNVIARSGKHLPQEILPLLRSFQPYESGNSLLWAGVNPKIETRKLGTLFIKRKEVKNA